MATRAWLSCLIALLVACSRYTPVASGYTEAPILKHRRGASTQLGS